MEESDGETADSVWFGYECKSGEILFYYNQKTGEHRWAKDLCCSESNIIKVSISDLSVKHPSDVHSVGTQTEDYGCTNGCSSIYIHNEDHIVTSNRDESMCPVDRPSNMCGVSVDDGDHLEPSETMIPNREDEDNVIDEEWNGGSEKLENDEDSILTDSCQSTGLLPENPPENDGKCNKESDSETQNLNFDSMMTDSCQSSIGVPMLIKDDKSIGNRNEAFSHQSILNCPIKTHTGEKPYKCSHCKKVFSQKRYLKLHIRTHTGEKPFKCLYCDKAFSSKSNLNCHIKGHTGEKPFKCLYCGKAFSSKSNLNCHTKGHTGERPFKCLHCSKALSNKLDFIRHIRMHTGEKPFKCLHCGKAFSQKPNLIRHIRTHTGEKPFKCPHCGKAFSQKSSLNNHIKTHTGE